MKALSHVKGPPHRTGPTGPQSMMGSQLHQQAGTRGSRAVEKPSFVDPAWARDDNIQVWRWDSETDMGEG